LQTVELSLFGKGSGLVFAKSVKSSNQALHKTRHIRDAVRSSRKGAKPQRGFFFAALRLCVSFF
jgi:hypothetical protein